MAKANVAQKRTDHYAVITNQILAALDAGVKPWARPWTTSGGSVELLDAALPYNIASGRNYRGLNVPLLWCAAQTAGYTSHQWLSFKQAEELGGNVRKGERATYVYWFKILERPERNEDGEAETMRRIPLLRSYPVFNVAQCDGLKLPVRATKPLPKADSELGVVGTIVDGLRLGGGLRHGGDKAFYMPGYDSMQMPKADVFTSRDGYLAVLLHECGHATGHTSRLARQFSDRFGSDSYAFEELVAELCSAFSQAALGLRADIEQHASYIESWSQIMRKDSKAFAKACSLAQAAADYLLGHPAEDQDAEDDGAVELAQAA